MTKRINKGTQGENSHNSKLTDRNAVLIRKHY